MQVLGDTFVVEVIEKDSVILSGDSKCNIDTHLYKMDFGDISDIIFSTKQSEIYGYKSRESFIEFEALRFYRLFKHSINGRVVANTDIVKIPIVNHQDTTHFKQLVDLLKNHVDLENNYIAPSCEVEEVLLGMESGKRIKAIEVGSLEKRITLNGSENLEEELRHILINYLEQENIKKLFGTILINQQDQLQEFYNDQNEMYNYLKTLDSLPRLYMVLKETAFYKITDKQKSHIDEILSKQKWTSGQCKNQKVDSYFNFHIANAGFMESGGK